MYITTRQKRKIFSSLVLISGLVFFLVLGFIFVPSFFERADLAITPQNVLLSNWTHDSVTVTWTTERRTKGAAKVYQGDEQVGEFEDVRGNRSTFTHYVELRNLEPNVEYTFSIVSDGKVFSGEDGFQDVFVSAPVIGNSPSPNVVRGRVDDLKDNDGLVFLFAEEVESSIISTYIGNNGEWSLDLMDLRSGNLDEYIGISQDSDSMVNLVFYSNIGSKMLLGNNNTLFGEERFLGDVKLAGQEEEVFASLYESSITSPLVMGEEDEVSTQEGRMLIRSAEDDGEQGDDDTDLGEQGVSEIRQRRVDWTPLNH